MITVKSEWEEADSDEKKLDWAKKWGNLLLEEFQNPIWLSGYTHGKKELIDKIKGIKFGNPITEETPEELKEYAAALQLINKNLKFVTYNMIAEKEVAERITDKELLEVASTQIAPVLVKFIEIDAIELEDGRVNFVFNLVFVE